MEKGSPLMTSFENVPEEDEEAKEKTVASWR